MGFVPRSIVVPGLLLVATPAAAMTLGPLELRSALGEPFEARIPIAAEPGEPLSSRCFRLADGGASPSPRVDIRLVRGSRVAHLRVYSRSPVREPAFLLRVSTDCPGAAPGAVREFPVLLDPRPEATRPTQATSFEVRPGDTLDAIARSIFPRQPTARRIYVNAVRERNAALSSVGDKDALPAGTVLALPDLQVFANSKRLASAAQAVSPRPVPSARQAARLPSATGSDAPTVASAPPPASAPLPPRNESVAAAGRESRSNGFALRLSTGVDLARLRAADDRTRDQLRERRLALDADDHVAALLALRHNVRQLESRIAELQLKLSRIPAAAAPEVPPAKPTAAAEPAKPAAPVDSAKPAIPAEPAKPAARAEPAQAPTATQAPAAPEPAKPETATQQPPSAAAAAPKSTASEARRPRPHPAPTDRSWPWSYGLAIGLAILLGIVFLLRRRRNAGGEGEETTMVPSPTAATEPAPTRPANRPEGAGAASARPSAESDAGLPTSIPDSSASSMRRRYIEERFPEVASGAIVLDEADSVVKGARLFYEDGAVGRAVELLQFAIEDRPGEVKPWLALFEIFRLERLTGQFAELAERFRAEHGDTPWWRKVQFFGREIDPDNSLYEAPAEDHLQTIGFRAGMPPAFDPVTENWLNAPMDFENEVLANELRKALMSRASVTEQDLAPDPMPALRKVEVFNVA